jgi:hypothetical protein
MKQLQLLICFLVFTFFSKAQQELIVFEAIKTKDLKKFEKGLKKGVNLQARDNQGFTFLHTLFHYSGTPLSDIEKKMLVKLITEGCDVNAVANNRYAITVLDGAIRAKDVEAVEMVLKAGARVNQGYPLHMACFKRSLDCVNLLINNNADVNRLNDMGVSPIVHLLTYADPYNATKDIIEVLHKNGANIFELTNQGESLVDLANKNNNNSAANYLRARGVVARIKPPPPPDYGAKKVRISLSRKYTSKDETATETNSSVLLVDITPDVIKIYNSEAKLVLTLTVQSSRYFVEKGVHGIEYITKDANDVTYFAGLLEIPNMYTTMNNRRVPVTGYNSFFFGTDQNNHIQLDAEW